MRKQPERALLLRCIKLLRLAGWRGGKIKTHGGMTKQGRFIFDPYQLVGLPDALFFRGGIALAIETKSATGRLSEAQERFQELWCHAPDRIYRVVRDESEIEEWWKR